MFLRLIVAISSLLFVCPATVQAQPLPVAATGRPGAEHDRQVAEIAREVIAASREPGRYIDLDSLFRAQLVVGDNAGAIATIKQVRESRKSPTSAPIFIQYEVLARARQISVQRRLPLDRAWQAAFAEVFGRLNNKAALDAELAFRGNLPRMQRDLERVLARLAAQSILSPEHAIELLRAWQVHSSYTAISDLFDAALNADDARRYFVDRKLLLRMRDGTPISALVVRPRRGGKLPTLFSFTIYANDQWALADAKVAAAHGYAGVVAYSRGKGRAGGPIMPYETDGADAADTIAWIARQSWSDGRVGMYGGSYNAFTQWAALKHRPPALKAIATSASAAPGIDVPMEGGVFMNFMYPWPFYVATNSTLNDDLYGDAGRWSAANRNWFFSGRAYKDLPAIDGTPNPIFEKWLKHPTYDQYWQAFIPQQQEFADIGIPVLATTGYFDGAQISVLHYLREHLRRRPNADHTLVIGPFSHFAMQTGVAEAHGGYTLDPAARINLPALRIAWFDHVLKGKPRPELLADRVNWQVMGANTWRHASTLDAMATRSARFYLAPSGHGDHNALAPAPAPSATFVQKVDFGDRSNASWQAESNVLVSKLDPADGLVFSTATFDRATELAGAFSATLFFTINKRDFDLAYAIWEQNAQGQYLNLAYGIQRASLADDRRVRKLLQPGDPQQIVLRDTRLLGRMIGSGSRLILTLGVIKRPDLQLNMGSGKDPAEETIADAGPPMEIRWSGRSYIDVPIREES